MDADKNQIAVEECSLFRSYGEVNPCFQRPRNTNLTWRSNFDAGLPKELHCVISKRPTQLP